MTRLLVSVRSLDEAFVAAAAGVDLIDVKEPTRGPLGKAAASVRRAIGQQLGSKYLLSAACGELRDFVARRVSEGDKIRDAQVEFDSPDAWTNYRYAKIGLAGCANDPTWPAKWLTWRAALPTFVEPVLVCYADGERCGAPTYEVARVFATAHQIGMILFDTWDKHGPGLCELWQAAEFLRISQELHAAQIAFVLAGKLRLEDVSELRRFSASYLGIRGAVCNSGQQDEDRRCGILDAAKIQLWRQSL
jgi:uncharacterized protein (UPF0264 family)